MVEFLAHGLQNRNILFNRSSVLLMHQPFMFKITSVCKIVINDDWKVHYKKNQGEQQ